MTRYLLDTNIIISIINNEDPELVKKIKERSPAEFAVSIITHAELVYGYERMSGVEKFKKKIDRRLEPFYF